MFKPLICLPSLLCLSPGAPSRTASAPYHITEIRAHLYYQETGGFDTTDLISDTSVALWNTNFGQGNDNASGATLVLVRVDGNWTSWGTKPHLLVRVEFDSGGPVLSERNVDLRSLFSERHSVWVPYIVYGTGCGTIRITATLLDEHALTLDTLSKTIPFECGE